MSPINDEPQHGPIVFTADRTEYVERAKAVPPAPRMDDSIGFQRVSVLQDDAGAARREAEMQRLAALRPNGDTARDYRDALQAIENEKPLARAVLDGAALRAKRALIDLSPPAVIQAARSAEDLARIECQRLDAMAETYAERLRAREANEAGADRLLAQRVPAAQAALKAWLAFYREHYPRLAAELARGMEMEIEAHAAFRVLSTAASRGIAGAKVPEPLPRTRDQQLLAAAVNLPGYHRPVVA